MAVIAGGRIVEVAAPASLGRTRTRPRRRSAWTEPGGDRRSMRTSEPTRVVAELAARIGGEVPDLSVARPTLEDTYLTLIGQQGGTP